MPTSETIKEITTALVGFHKEVGSIPKDSLNPFFKSSYASLSNILSTIDPILVKHGLVVVQLPTGDHGLSTSILHTSGEWIESTYTMTPKDDSPQGLGSAITYQRRYALAAALSLNIGDDDDGNAASKAPKEPTKPEKKTYEKLPDGDYTLTVSDIKKGQTNGMDWVAIVTDKGRLFNNTEYELEVGETYDVKVVKNGIFEIYGQPE